MGKEGGVAECESGNKHENDTVGGGLTGFVFGGGDHLQSSHSFHVAFVERYDINKLTMKIT